jgi:predicted ribosomally synthesized peptide with SipW-like signal peptide
MGRQTLRITIVLGMLVTLLGGTGIFATFSDRATAGDNSVTTGERAKAADLKIAAVDPSEQPAGATLCVPATTTWSDDTTTAQFTAGSIQPGDHLQPAYLCLLNAGTGPLSVNASVLDVVDADIDCTGDEAAAGDTTCGVDQTTLQPQDGELSPLLVIAMSAFDCSDPGTTFGPGTEHALSQYGAQPIQFTAAATGFVLAPNSVACLRLQATYPTPTEAEAQIAQTDRVTWKFAFDATAQ